MSPARKPTRKAAPKLQSALDRAIQAAIDSIADPKVQAQIAEHAKAVAGQLQTHAGKAYRAAGQNVGQAKLEARVKSLRSAVAILGEPDAAVAERLREIVASIDQVKKAVDVAGTLPLVKRKRAHLRLDRHIDRLEHALFDTALEQAD